MRPRLLDVCVGSDSNQNPHPIKMRCARSSHFLASRCCASCGNHYSYRQTRRSTLAKTGSSVWMAILSKDEIGKLCVAAALALCIAHILTMIGTEYQVYGEYRDRWSFSGFPSGDLLQVFTGVLVNYGTFLSPVILLLIVRRFCLLVGVIAFPVAVFFVLRVHHVWEFYWFGINSMARQKGDALGWCTLIFDMISAAIVAPVLLGLLIEKLIGGLQGRRTGRSSRSKEYFDP